MKPAGKYKHVHEGSIQSLIDGCFSIEDLMPYGHSVRHALYKVRITLAQVIVMNRENEGKPQDRWVIDETPAQTSLTTEE